MGYWLLKADPSDYGYDDLVRDRKTYWDGVSNALALKHLRKISKGDQVLIYHSGKEKALAGIAEAVSAAYPDPKKQDERLVVFDVKPKKKLRQGVTLADIKADAQFAEFELVRLPRLSVMPVPAALWKKLLKMAGEKP